MPQPSQDPSNSGGGIADSYSNPNNYNIGTTYNGLSKPLGYTNSGGNAVNNSNILSSINNGLAAPMPDMPTGPAAALPTQEAIQALYKQIGINQTGPVSPGEYPPGGNIGPIGDINPYRDRVVDSYGPNYTPIGAMPPGETPPNQPQIGDPYNPAYTPIGAMPPNQLQIGDPYSPGMTTGQSQSQSQSANNPGIGYGAGANNFQGGIDPNNILRTLGTY